MWTSPIITEMWPEGRHSIGSLTFESAAYIARYLMKKQTGWRAHRRYGTVIDTSTGEITLRRKPEYVTMSLKPGIGHDWIHKYMNDVYPRDYIIINGKKARPPKYYDQQYALVDPDGYKKLKVSRAQNALQYEDDNTYDRLETKARVLYAKTTQFEREPNNGISREAKSSNREYPPITP